MSLGPPPHLPSPVATPGTTTAPQPPINDGTIPMDQAMLRTELESQLLRLSQDLYELEICAGDVGTGMEDAVPNYLMKINQGFVNLSQLSSQMTDSVPHQVLEHIDRFKNPHLYTKTVITRATGENQYALGRVLGLESFRRQLHDALEEDFPEIPLPERRHQPISVKEETGTGVVSADGGIALGQAEARGQVNGDVRVKTEEGGGEGNEPPIGGVPNGSSHIS
ncbi:hypothetical protein I316_07644 [Kwoniella heveanensis BCC8398]|uniref:Mediator of RNA polymerase II transcription subunit 10 n=1 Tax=Kwoniella heveanensis BCC8398 TaxID=1296120 RepID=A0A1B9GHZ4_9TREE|nr:hypothetical protein I316_07644 [Kwoniella heveanensis BCC8398]